MPTVLAGPDVRSLNSRPTGRGGPSASCGTLRVQPARGVWGMGAKIEPEPQVPPPGGASQGSSHLHLVSAAASTAQKIPDKRSLSEAELVQARKVFAGGLKYEVVRVEKMGGFTELLNGSRAYTMGNT